jgi:hypothetical protein
VCKNFLDYFLEIIDTDYFGPFGIFFPTFSGHTALPVERCDVDSHIVEWHIAEFAEFCLYH